MCQCYGFSRSMEISERGDHDVSCVGSQNVFGRPCRATRLPARRGKELRSTVREAKFPIVALFLANCLTGEL